MISIFKQEMKLNFKSFLIWCLTVGGMGFVCTCLYSTMGDSMKGMADSFSNMGAFSDAFGMSTLSIASIEGFFATEVGTVHGLGSAMFAAILAVVILSKEEDSHTGEFLYSLPVSRFKAVTAKVLTVLAYLTAFTVICGLMYCAGFACLKEDIPYKEMVIFLGGMLLMNAEIGAICLVISAFSDKNKIGLGLGIALLFYVFDLMGRVVPDLKKALVIGPFSYCNASEIFSGTKTNAAAFIIAAACTVSGLAVSYGKYLKKDLRA